MKLKFRILCFILIPIVLLPLVLVKREKYLDCLYMIILMAAFWALDVLPYGVTSLIPILFAPLMRIQHSGKISSYFSSDSLMLCLGRLIMACAFQQQQIHRRFGLFLITKFGPQPRMLMLACMLPSYILTMFISNTATAPIMLEFVIEVLEEIKLIKEGTKVVNNETSRILTDYGSGDLTPIIQRRNSGSSINTLPSTMNDQYPSMTNIIERPKEIEFNSITLSIKKGSSNPDFDKLALGLSLCTGYGASCGSVATLVACGPNLVLYGLLDKYHLTSSLNYGTFMAFGLPLSVVIFFITWMWVGIVNVGPKTFFEKRSNTTDENRFLEKIKEKKEEMGKFSFSEMSCIGLTGLVIILWITRHLGKSNGWGFLFVDSDNKNQYVSDATPMILVIILFYIWPSKLKFWQNDGESLAKERLLSWDFTHKNLPWAIIFLLGTGFAITDICKESGFTDHIKNQLIHIKHIGVPALVIICSILSCVTTELLSSTTILPVYISIFKSLACEMHINPLIFAIPLTLSASFAFCLPAATTPNIAIFSRGLATTRQMIKTGLLMDIVYIFIVTFFTFFLVVPVFHIKMDGRFMC